MSFGNKKLDKAYDRWKTQSPEEAGYYEEPDDEDREILKASLSKTFQSKKGVSMWMILWAFCGTILLYFGFLFHDIWQLIGGVLFLFLAFTQVR